MDRQLVRALHCLGKMQLEIGEPQTALESALDGIRLDPYRERNHRCLMTLVLTLSLKQKLSI